MSEVLEQSTSLIKADDFKQIMQSAPEALQLNQQLVEKAVAAGDKLLVIAAERMDDDVDAQCNDYLVKLRDRYQLMNDRRSPLTKMMDEIRSVFTDLEKKISPKEKESIYAKVQKVRDDYAKKKREEQLEKERLAQVKLATDKEKIDVKASLETALSSYFNNHVQEIKSLMYREFEALTLENFAANSQKFKTPVKAYSNDHFNRFTYTPQVRYIKSEDVAAIRYEVMNGKLDEYNKSFSDQVSAYKQELADKLHSKFLELEKLRDADKAEKKRLNDEAKKREEAEALRLAAEQAAADTKAEETAKATAAAETTNVTFENQMSLMPEESTTQVREGVKIEVLHPSGYLLIVSFYFQNGFEGKTVEELGKRTLAQMVAFAEKSAMKDDKKRIESQYIKYSETFKTVAKK